LEPLDGVIIAMSPARPEHPLAMGRKAQTRKRVEEVARLRAAGAEYPEIFQFAAKSGWGVGMRSLYGYMRRADDLLTQQIERRRDFLLAKRLIRRDVLWSKALQAGDLHLALAVEKDTTALLGLYPPRDKTPPAMVVQNAIPLPTDAERESLRQLTLAHLDRGANDAAGADELPGQGRGFG
jgi:hypothetical protein